MPKVQPSLSDQLDERLFRTLYSSSLVYNTCWEDPAVDRQALNFTPDDVVLVLTSAGCNALDYALKSPRRIHAVDANPRQTALLELKIAGIRALEFDDFFRIFGNGSHPQFAALYRASLREQLSEFARGYWDKRLDWFSSPSGSFYYHGLSGLVARGFSAYLGMRPRLGSYVRALFGASTLDEQRAIYDQRVAPDLWNPFMRWTLSRQFTLSMLGVPHPQRREIEAQHQDGVAGYVQESVEYVLRQLPIWTNYFWSLYLHGRYTRACCPEYLKEENFQELKAGKIEIVSPHTLTVTDFLRSSSDRISKYVLLDHMDWMANYYPQALAEEWQEIFAHATPTARVIFRSAHARPRFLDTTIVDGVKLSDRLVFHEELARELTRQDRVHTYAGFHICDVPA